MTSWNFCTLLRKDISMLGISSQLKTADPRLIQSQRWWLATWFYDSFQCFGCLDGRFYFCFMLLFCNGLKTPTHWPVDVCVWLIGGKPVDEIPVSPILVVKLYIHHSCEIILPNFCWWNTFLLLGRSQFFWLNPPSFVAEVCVKSLFLFTFSFKQRGRSGN